MSKRRITAGAAVSLLASVAVAAGVMSPAHADVAPQKNDVVGVGSDALQNAFDFLADGVTLNGKTYAGYNETAAAAKWRLFDFDASGDANGGLTDANDDPTTGAGGVGVVLQNGTSPVNRPNGGGAGLTALVNDGTHDLIDFARNPTAPTATQESTAQTSGTGYIDTIQIASDVQYIAHVANYNGPATLPAADVLKIYTGAWKTWGALADGDPSLNYAPSATVRAEKIIPLYPKNGAGMQSIFLSGLTKANNGTKPAANALTNGIQVKQNDPYTLNDPSLIPASTLPTAWAGTTFTAADSANVIVPFPASRVTLLEDGYLNEIYNTPGYTGTPQNSLKPLADKIVLVKDSTSFSQTVPYLIDLRHSDFASTTAWQPGSKLSWVQTLFYNTKWHPGIKATTKTTTKTVKKHGKKVKVKVKVTVPAPAAPWAFGSTGQALIKALGLTPTPYASAYTPYTTYVAGS